MYIFNFAADKQNPIAIYTSLDGLIKAGLDFLASLIKDKRFTIFCIHLPDDTGNMRGFSFTESYLYALETLLPLEGVTCMTMSAAGGIDPKVLTVLGDSPKHSLILKSYQSMPLRVFEGRGA
jgi:hypothetical protein